MNPRVWLRRGGAGLDRPKSAPVDLETAQLVSPMIILAHRGCWRENSEKNTRAAFLRAFEAGYGIETDVRDLDGELVVSHDPARRGAMRWGELLDLYVEHGAPGQLAINIKADGLAAGKVVQGPFG